MIRRDYAVVGHTAAFNNNKKIIKSRERGMYIQRTKEKKKTFHGRKKPALTIRTVFLDGKINECVNTCNKQVNKSAGHQQCMRTGRKFSPMIVNVRQ